MYEDEAVGNRVVHKRRPVADLDSPSTVLIDPALETENNNGLVGIGPMSVSHDGLKLAFLKDLSGNEAWQVCARNLDPNNSPIALPDWLKNRVAKALEWDASGRFLFLSLTAENELMRPSVCVVIDTENGHSEVVAEEPDPHVMLELSATKDRKYIRIGRLSYTSSEQASEKDKQNALLVFSHFYLIHSL